MGAAINRSKLRPPADGGAVDGGRVTQPQQVTIAEIRSLIFRCISSIPTLSPPLHRLDRCHRHLWHGWTGIRPRCSCRPSRWRRSGTESPGCGVKAPRAGAPVSRRGSETVLHLYGDRVLAFDTATARIAGTMSDRARGLGHAPGLADIIIAATAKHRGLTILSRNLRHLEPLGVAVVDPFVKLPPG